MTTRLLDTIDTPDDLAGLSRRELEQLAVELRSEMVAVTAQHGGHLAPSLGAVEIIIALHRVLSCPEDRLVFDVGHQAYAHKLLTGRRKEFATLRCLDGISGFPKIEESRYDAHNAGHASDALSVALGYALARDIDGRSNTVAAVVGDAAFAGGMSMEALNQIGQLKTKLLIVLNDNGMSISRSVGGFASYLARARMNPRYTTLRDHVEEAVSSRGRVGRFIMGTGNAVKDSVKQLVLPGGMFFEQFGITYVGPVDGHDISTLEAILRDAKALDGPVVVHAVTTKGKGYHPAEQHPDTFHGIAPFDSHTGQPLGGSEGQTWTNVFSQELVRLGAEHRDVVAITAAMPAGTGLNAFAERFPERFVDVGIAEEHAVGLASALALAGKVPFVAIYSTFIQRAYDQAVVNVALQNQHVVFCLDRAGLVGEDGPTHHGAFDLSFMRSIPNMTILAPSDGAELRDALWSAYELDGPVCIRYPRGAVADSGQHTQGQWRTPEANMRREGSDVALLAVGTMVVPCLKAADILAQRGIEACVYDMRWVKPLDVEAVRQAAKMPLVVTVEENSTVGGFGAAVLEALSDEGLAVPVLRLGLPDAFCGQGPVAKLRSRAGLDASGIAEAVSGALAR